MTRNEQVLFKFSATLLLVKFCPACPMSLSFYGLFQAHSLFHGHSHLVDGRVGVDLADVCPVVVLPD